MCGILLYTDNVNEERLVAFRELMLQRGPDACGKSSVIDGWTVESSVLCMRPPLTTQPLSDDMEVLAFNGEIYGVEGNDTRWMWRNRRSLIDIRPEGEYAFAYFDGRQLWFGRDSIGRRSLLYKSDERGVIICSVSPEPGFTECAAGTLYTCYPGQPPQPLSPSIPKSISLNVEYADNKSTELLDVLKKAVRSRIHPHGMTVLFSGGLDCTVLVKLLDEVAPPQTQIELLNVAFENKRTGQLPCQAPDRVLAQKTYDINFAASSRISLTLVDIPYAESVLLKPIVRVLMAPNDTEMDLSIALPFWCAARASSFRTLISGLGADELFGGYARHSRAWDISPERLSNELTLDFSRLGQRNLGRDDRVTSAHAREMRYPYLDSDVVDWARALPLAYKVNKRVLREAALELGLESVSEEPKRAVQFGSRAAKMEPGSGSIRGQAVLSSGPSIE